MKKKIFIAGASGFLGINLINLLSNDFILYNAIHKNKININKKNLINIDMKNFEKSKRKLISLSPDIIIHSAALTDIEKCEKNKTLCYNANYKVTEKLLEISKIIKAKFIYISSDSLFKGNKSFYKENEKKKTLNYYSFCKSKSEEYIIKNYKNYLIIRTNFFGFAPSTRKSLLDFICDNLSKKKKIFLYKNVFFTPISIYNLIKVLSKLIRLNTKGIYNVCGNERISKYQFGLKMAKIFNFDKNLIIESELMQKKIIRPLDMSLSNKKIKNIFGNNIILNLDGQLKNLQKMYTKNIYYKIKNSLKI